MERKNTLVKIVEAVNDNGKWKIYCMDKFGNKSYIMSYYSGKYTFSDESKAKPFRNYNTVKEHMRRLTNIWVLNSENYFEKN